MPEEIQILGPNPFRVQVGHNGVYQTKTFERLSDAQAIKDKQSLNLRRHDLRHEGISRLFQLTDLRENEIIATSGI